MKEARTTIAVNASAVKKKMNAILELYYPSVFDASQAIIAAAEDLEQTPGVKKVKSAIDAVYNAIERLFYKEKIVFFPYLEKHFATEDKSKIVPAINNAIDESMRIAKMVESFRTWALGEDADDRIAALDVKILEAFAGFESAWWALCVRKDKLFASFVALKQNNN